MTKYEKLLCEYCDDIEVYEETMKSDGLYSDGIIWINKTLQGSKKCCILAEEIGHYFTSSGDILNQGEISNAKQEYRARAWAVDKLLPFDEFEDAIKFGCHTAAEIAEFLNIDEDFLRESIEHYKRKLGVSFPISLEE